MMEIRRFRKKYDGNAEQFGKVAVIYGGNSAEREVSLKSGDSVLNALKSAGVNAIGIDSKDGYITHLLDGSFDRAFIMVHGKGGEDGKMQAILEELNIPYTGSDFAASAVSLNKSITKKIWQNSGIPTPRFYELNEHSDWDGIFRNLEGKVFIKPSSEGSSIGMSIATSAEQLKNGYLEASKFDSTVLAEKYINGEEYTVGIIGRNPLPVVKIKVNNDFYDYEAKYVSNDTQYFCPSELDLKKEQQLKSIAMSAFDNLGCSGWGRVDILLDKLGNIFLLEINTVPGMTDHSLIPLAARAVGLNFEELVLEILMQTM